MALAEKSMMLPWSSEFSHSKSSSADPSSSCSSSAAAESTFDATSEMHTRSKENVTTFIVFFLHPSQQHRL